MSTAAARTLATLPSTPEVVAALKLTTRSADHYRVYWAGRTLSIFDVSGWQDEVIARLSTFRELPAIQLSGVLAMSGRADGWTYIANGLKEYHPEAVRQTIWFHGLRDSEGNTIDALKELQSLSDRPEAGRHSWLSQEHRQSG